ncbi:hypothetical protein BJ165DRAFT_1457260 [Panaeolus papilionaceus]|nr:hypothetical protein BJ165DRAFT_1457260 [Panaeolus papilionaceus]
MYLHLSQDALVQALEPYGQFVTDLAHEGGLESTEERMKLLLCHCPNIKNLALWGYSAAALSRIFPVLQALTRLKKLGFVESFSALSQEQMSSSLFMILTHLDIMTIDLQDCTYIVKFQKLSHICINKNPTHLGAVLRRLTLPETGCPSLRIIVNADPNPRDTEGFDHPCYFKLDMVSEYREDWLNGANGGVDFWKYSEEKVMARMTGH